jgi:hypothetical protein
MRAAFWTVVLLYGLAGSAIAQQVPVLHYTPPSDAYRSAITPPDDFSFNGFNASLQVYAFRPFHGNLEQAFRQDLLAQSIDGRHREENASEVRFSTLSVPGADSVVKASFIESRVGLPRPHNRVLIVAGNQAAIVDASAGTMQSWILTVPALQAVINSLRVDSAPAPPDVSKGPGAAGTSIAGLYMGNKVKYMASMINIVGHASYQNALHFYLFSADGRVYRAYDQLNVPGGDPYQFDFASAAQRDPVNSGRYSLVDGQLYIQMNGQQPEVITAPLPADGILTINSIHYKRR